MANQLDITNFDISICGRSTSAAHHNHNNHNANQDERICLVGSDLSDDENVLLAAKSFNVPIVTSQTGTELINDTQWTTYFVMNEFQGEHYNAIRKTKHRIFGPTALQQIAQSGKGLIYVNRPLYNFSMKGAVTCFTGIRKKDELTRLVNLIHMMGGSIRKDMKENSRCTHLICSTSAGEKYHYAKTFNLTIVRPSWIYAAWEQRNDPKFFANDREFCESHKLKQFEGLRICLYGFSAEDYQEMVEIMQANGGTPTDIDDPECTHLILASHINQFPELLSGPTSPPPQLLPPPPPPPPTSSLNLPIITSTATSSSSSAAAAAVISPSITSKRFDQLHLNEKPTPKSVENKCIPTAAVIDETPTKIHSTNRIVRHDGIILPGNEENHFLEPTTNLSPILQNIEEEEEESEPNTNAGGGGGGGANDANNEKEMSKRKRLSFDNISILSTDTFAAHHFNSAKKPKLIRTGSITRALRRSMSFAALKNPITNMIRSRRNSIDPNASFSSITSMDTTITCRKFDTTMCEKTPKIDTIDSHTTSFYEQQPHRDTTAKHFQEPPNSIDVADNSANVGAKPLISTPLPPPPPKLAVPHVVKSDWFWYTIQKGFASEDEHRFNEYLENMANTPTSAAAAAAAAAGDRRESLPGIRRKRKRFSILAQATNNTKRRSSIHHSSDAALSVSGSFLDCTNSPSIKHDGSRDFDCSMDVTPKAKHQKSMRFNHFMDLYSTESNYVGILHTIVSEFQKPLENMVDTPEELLNKSELRSIFKNFSPIYEVHRQMLNHFKEIQSNWDENCLIGKIILDHRDALLKAYPPYVNFFEQMKDTLQQCIAQNPKFHAFLKIKQSKPECGRQTLQDLMIRPVQRLPSISLLISDISKHTPQTNADHKVLENALNAIKNVMEYINEDKRKTEGRVALFDIFNDIENCPVDIVSSHRRYISRCEVTELSDCLNGRRDDALMIFLFTDYIEICKIRKSRAGTNHLKSPTGTMTNALNTTTTGSTATTTKSSTHASKPYKHIRLIPLNAIPCIYDVKDCERAFAVNVNDKLYCFNINNEEYDKQIYLKNFCKQLAENACRADYEQFLHSCESHELGIDISDINSVGTLKKVYNYARTRLVSRAFSFKTTTPLRMKRAGSTTSPLYASTNSLM